MRVAMVLHWVRAAASSKTIRKAANRYAVGITIAQILWVLNYLYAGEYFIPISCVLIGVELLIPVIAEKELSREGGTPWHPHHIAERYRLLVIIVLGEGILATTSTFASLVSRESEWLEAFPLGLGAAGLMFGLWWSYFRLPFGQILHESRASLHVAFLYGYGHYFIFASLAAVGVGLQLVADAAAYHGHSTSHSEVTAQFALICTSVPVAIYLSFMCLYRTLLVKESRYNWVAWIIAMALPSLPVLMNRLGMPLHWAVWFSVLAPGAFVVLNSFDDCTSDKAA